MRVHISALLGVALVLISLSNAAQEAQPPLLGYGVKSCDDYLVAWDGAEAEDPIQLSEYLRYRSWLAGFTSGLNLATGQDTLRGADLEDAMKRTAAYCRGNRSSDFFNAVMDFIKLLRLLK